MVEGLTGTTLVPMMSGVGHNRAMSSVAFFPDGLKLASGSEDKTVRIWDTKTGKAIHAPLIGHTSPVMSVAVSPRWEAHCIRLI